MTTPAPTPRQLDILRSLYFATRSAPDAWARPLDIGGYAKSHHASVLVRLILLGLVERRARNERWVGLPNYEYRPTASGIRVITEHEVNQ